MITHFHKTENALPTLWQFTVESLLLTLTGKGLSEEISSEYSQVSGVQFCSFVIKNDMVLLHAPWVTAEYRFNYSSFLSRAQRVILLVMMGKLPLSRFRMSLSKMLYIFSRLLDKL